MDDKKVDEKKNLDSCDCGCDCGDNCDCGSDCDCGCDCGDNCDCGDDCGCEGDCDCEDDPCKCHDHGAKDKNKCLCCSGKCSGKGVFGFLVLAFGVFYLGKNVGWWNIDMNWSIFWPIIIILAGLMIIVKSRKK